jgi:hypothetical protein
MNDLVQVGMQDAMKSLMQALMELHKVQAGMQDTMKDVMQALIEVLV